MLACKLSFDACYWRVYGLHVVSRISNQIICHFFFLVQSSALQSIKIMIMKGINSQITLMKTVSRDFTFLVFRAFTCKKDEWKNKQTNKQTDCILLQISNVHAQLRQSCLTLCDSMDRSPPGFPLSMRFSRQNSGMGSHFLLQRIFPTQGSSLGFLQLLHCRWILYPLSYLGSSDF